MSSIKRVVLTVLALCLAVSVIALAAPAPVISPIVTPIMDPNLVAPIKPGPAIDPNLFVIDPNMIVIDPNFILPFDVGTVQQVVIPYATNDATEWASGLSIHNMGSSTVYYQVSFRLPDGSLEDGDTFSIPGYGSKTDIVPNFDDEDTLSGTVSIYIRTLNEDKPFAATLFIGNSSTFKGFGFQSFFSSDKTLFLIDDPTP
jgi:hypothetical protein